MFNWTMDSIEMFLRQGIVSDLIELVKLQHTHCHDMEILQRMKKRSDEKSAESLRCSHLFKRILGVNPNEADTS